MDQKQAEKRFREHQKLTGPPDKKNVNALKRDSYMAGYSVGYHDAQLPVGGGPQPQTSDASEDTRPPEAFEGQSHNDQP